MEKIPFEDGVKLKNATVTIQEQEYEVKPAQYQGKTPMSSFNLNKMQDNIDDAKAEKTEVATLNTKVTNLENTKANKTDLIPQELDVSSLLQNNWTEYNMCQIFKINNIVHLQLCVRNGTETTVMTLPEGYRPSKTMFIPATINGSNVTDPYVSINASGQIQCANANKGNLMFINSTYKV